MSSLEEIRKKRLEELRLKQMQEQAYQQMQDEETARRNFEAQLAQVEAAIKQYFTPEALSRYGNLKAAHPDKALQLLAVLGELIQTRRIGRIDDETLKSILQRIQQNTQKKFSFNIKRK